MLADVFFADGSSILQAATFTIVIKEVGYVLGVCLNLEENSFFQKYATGYFSFYGHFNLLIPGRIQENVTLY